MALFTDGQISTIEDLRARETEVLDVASSEGIDLTSKLETAAGDVGMELTAILLSEGEACARELSRVVVTPPLRQWHVFRTLGDTYRDAYHRQLNERFTGKWQMYQRLEASAIANLKATGIGIAAAPIPRAERPEVTAGEGTCTPGTYYVRAAWSDGQGREGAASEPVTYECDGAAPVVRALRPPAIASGWNVYVGLDSATGQRQNQAPLAIGSSWEGTEPMPHEGAEAPAGQTPDYYVTVNQRLRRG